MIVARDVEILLVEPDAADARRVTAILKRTRARTHISVVADAAQALAHLRREGSRYRSPRPNLILISADNLPRHGEDLLVEIKRDAKLLHIPIVFLRSSETDADVQRAYDLDANCYVRKPVTDEQIDRVLDVTKEFWLTIAKLPSD